MYARLNQILVLAAALMGLVFVPVLAPRVVRAEFAELTLEELMDVSIVSTTKRDVKLSATAAAVHVITAEDIRRAGCQSIPEALRLAPGVNVARIDAGSWAVAIRGFNGRFADKLLVMIDGRSVYTPMFSGVFWENIDVVMEDVAQIEVVRGPGAAIWGANATNGVINIITRKSDETHGGLAVAGGGSFEKFFGVARYGGRWGDTGSIRGFAKYRDIGPAQTEDGDDVFDDARIGHGGFRTDHDDFHGGTLSVQGTVNTTATRQTDLVFTGLEPPYSTIVDGDNTLTEFALLGQWERYSDDGRGLLLKMFWDTADIGYVSNEARISRIDLEVNGMRRLGTHDLVWGTGYRLVDADFVNSFALSMLPPRQQEWGVNAFVNDDISLVPARLVLTLGAKFEYTTLGDGAFQPNLRARWTPRKTLSLWASAARAVRTPSLNAHSARVTMAVLPPGTLMPGTPEVWARYEGHPEVENEELLALEAGIRLAPAPWLAVDLAVFDNSYDRMLAGTLQEPTLGFLDGRPYVASTFLANNSYEARTWGGELALDLRPAAALRLRGAWSLLRGWSRAEEGVDALPALSFGMSPEHQGHIRLGVDATRDIAVDLAWRYVSELEDENVPAYRELSARLNWRATSNLDWGLTGHNLLNERHLEFARSPVIVSQRSYIPRYWSVDVRWKF